MRRRKDAYKPTTRIRLQPRFFLILFALFGLLSFSFFQLANAQLNRTIPEKEIVVIGEPVDPIASEKTDPDPADPNVTPVGNGTAEGDVPSGITSVTLEGAPVYVMLDPGHGGKDGGSYYGNLKESDLNLAIALYVRDYLQAQGIGVLMTRETDEMVGESQSKGLYTRALMCNHSNAVCFVSIHANTYSGDTAVSGIDTYRNTTTNPKSEDLAAYVQNETILQTGAKDRGLKEDSDLVVIRETTVPSCLIEVGFMTNPTEFEGLSGEPYRKKLALGIANGVIDFLIDEGYVKEVTVQ